MFPSASSDHFSVHESSDFGKRLKAQQMDPEGGHAATASQINSVDLSGFGKQANVTESSFFVSQMGWDNIDESCLHNNAAADSFSAAYDIDYERS